MSQIKLTNNSFYQIWKDQAAASQEHLSKGGSFSHGFTVQQDSSKHFIKPWVGPTFPEIQTILNSLFGTRCSFNQNHRSHHWIDHMFYTWLIPFHFSENKWMSSHVKHVNNLMVGCNENDLNFWAEANTREVKLVNNLDFGQESTAWA